ncbi:MULTISPECIES: PleD family two-component system response regulator [unclassified Paludibacterium]|uniref:response regulator n=1 Tax=unclassified Paludibacterium TaxID=2618429 RepID=UPI001C04083F|nr:response regulator [Paludibacterium sp. B53371]BEV71313.1 hypothetical protein THUN1379_07950 [Paludibacterium sp. THUN1379]
MTERPTILVVDDEALPRAFVSAALQQDYQVLEAENGEMALSMAQQHLPQLVLLDILMPGQDGFSVCRALRADGQTSEIPVLFVSAGVSEEDRLAAYEAGGDDFVSKPVNPAELLAKVGVVLKHASERVRLSDNSREAFQTAMTAMSSVAELGVVLQSLRQGFSCHGLAELAEVLLQACSEYQLDACVALRSMDDCLFRSQRGAVSAVEEGVLTHLAGTDRIRSLGRQTVFNDHGITLLIKNMPVEDGERAGRLRDNLALIVEGCQARLEALGAEALLRERELAAGLQQEKDAAAARQSQLLQAAMTALAEIDARHQTNRAQTEQILDSMLIEMENTFIRLSLTQQQEAAVAQMLRQTAEQISGLYLNGLDVAGHLRALRALQGGPR